MENQTKFSIQKVKTGIDGFDEITFGGLPYGRSTLVSGYAGTGKTAFAIQFILNGIEKYDEPGVYISLEETEQDLRTNMASFGYDLQKIEKSGKLGIENIQINQVQLHKSGQFDLSPLFIRIDEIVKRTGAKRVAIDTFEQLFSEIKDIDIFRQELVKMILWLKEKKLTSVFTSEEPKKERPKSGINEFITDCVVALSHSSVENVYTRRLRILKYRGSSHGTNEYPFLISNRGILLLPITSVEVQRVSNDIISTGIADLDERTDKKGVYVGSCTLLSGTSGVGKTSVAVSACIRAMEQKKRCLFFTFEESSFQLKRNMLSLGMELEGYEKEGLLKIVSTRPSSLGIEAHLVYVYQHIEQFKPHVVVFDPISDLIQVGTRKEVKGLLIRIIDNMKNNLITTFFTALVSSASSDPTLGMSSLVDNWLNLCVKNNDNKNEPYITIIKIRGMDHARQSFRLIFSRNGLKIKDD